MRSAEYMAIFILALSAISLTAIAPAVRAADEVGTYSIVARDSLTGELGVAVHSRVFAVGMRVAWAEAGVGAVATQAMSNESFGPRGLELMRAGLGAGEALEWLLRHDDAVENRQVGVVDAAGGVAVHTGDLCNDWAGHHADIDYTCQGNILAGEAVVADMARAFEDSDGELGQRLLAALVAAQAAGGDRRGVQSAALLIVRPSERFPEYRTRYLDLRVQDHTDPIGEIVRLYEMHEGTYLVQAHVRYAEDCEAAGDTAMARHEHRRIGDALKRALARGTEDAGMLNAMAWYTALADIYLDDALTAASRAVELEPENAEILDTLAEVHFRRGEIEEAIAVGEQALALDPESAYLKEQLARFRTGGK